MPGNSLISMETKENSIMQHLKNRASSHVGQGHIILMAILDTGRSGAIFSRVKIDVDAHL
jgi:hypothetical protein